MKVFLALDESLKNWGASAVAIGNFDGLHLGHQRILDVLIKKATDAQLNSLVLTFSPHPEKIFGQEPIKMIQTLEQRIEGFRLKGIDAALVAPFNDHFFRLEPEEFVADILVKWLKARAIVIGEDFRFGQARRGDAEFLRRAGKRYGFEVEAIPPVMMDGKIVSSSLIRGILEKGEVELASRYLGRAYEIDGLVGKGEARGRSLGIPTANIKPYNEILPPGVFITETMTLGRSFPSVTNIGLRPTFPQANPSIESHLLGFEGNLYGQAVRTKFYQKIREERKFASIEELREQVIRDIKEAAAFWRQRQPK